MLNWWMNSASSSSVCSDCKTCVSKRARLYPVSFTHGRWCRGHLLGGAARRAPSPLPEYILIRLAYPLLSSTNGGYHHLALLRRTGHVALRVFFLPPPPGCPGCALSAYRAPWGALLLRGYFTRLETRPTKQRRWQVGAHCRCAWIGWGWSWVGWGCRGGVGVGQWEGYVLLSIHFVSAVWFLSALRA